MSDKKEDKKKADKPKEDKKKADKPKEDKKKADKPKKEAEPKKEAAAAAAEKSSPAPAAAVEADAAGEAKAEKPKKEKKDKKEKKEKPADGAATDAGAETGAEDKKDDGPKFDPHNPPKQPNKVENDANIEAVEKGIRAIDNDLTKIRTAIDAKNAERQKIRAEKTTLLAELKHDGESRQKVMTAHKQLSSTIASAQAARDNSRHSLEASRKNLRFTTARELEDSIADVEMQIATSTLSTTTEKKLIAELKLLKAQRAEVALYAVELEKLKSKAAAEDTKKADTKGLLDDRHALGNQIKEMKESKLAKDEKMKELRAQENAIEQKIKDMLTKRNQMQKERKKLLDSKYDYKREFEKVTRAYEKWTRKKREFDHKQGRRAAAEESTRRANAPAEAAPLNTEHQKGYVAGGARPAAGTGNRRPKKEGKGDAADDDKPRRRRGEESDDEVVDMFEVLPWSREKMLADKLAAYVKSLQGKNAAQDKEDEKKAQTEEAAKQAELVAARNASFKDKRATTVAVGKNKTMKLEDFFGKDVSNSQKAAAKPSAKKPAVAAAEKGTTQLGAAKLEEKAAAPAAPKVRKFVHAIIVLHEFKEIHLNAPADSSQLEQSLKDLASRKAFYDSNPDNDDELKPAETKAAAPAAAASSSTPVAPSESSEEKTEKSNRKKGGKAADAAADAEKSRRVAEAAADKAAAATEERTERERRRSLATEAEDAEQKRRVAEDNKAKKDAADDEAKSRNANRRNSLQVMDEEQKRRIAEEAAHPHTEKSVIAQVDAAEHQIVKKVNDDLKSSGFEAFTPTGAAAAAPAAAADS